MKRVANIFVLLVVAFCNVQAQYPGGMPAKISGIGASMFSRMTPQYLAVVSQLADSGNGEVQDATTDLPLVNGQDDPISTTSHIGSD
jgi:hypothetical protein